MKDITPKRIYDLLFIEQEQEEDRAREKKYFENLKRDEKEGWEDLEIIIPTIRE